MEGTRSPSGEFDVLGLMATAPLMANALLTANAISAAPDAEFREDREPAGSRPEGESQASKLGLLERIDHWLWRLEQREIEARLAEATDIYDLEVRIRELERGAPWWSH